MPPRIRIARSPKAYWSPEKTDRSDAEENQVRRPFKRLGEANCANAYIIVRIRGAMNLCACILIRRNQKLGLKRLQSAHFNKTSDQKLYFLPFILAFRFSASQSLSNSSIWAVHERSAARGHNMLISGTSCLR